MFPPAATPDAARRAAPHRDRRARHGRRASCTRSRKGKPWSYVVGAPLNRRITGSTPFTFSGPAAGSALLKTRRGPDRHDRARHARQLRRRDHAVGHGAVRRGELQRLLPHRRHQRRRPALRPRRPGRPPAAGSTSTRGSTHRNARLRERAEPVRVDRRGRPAGPARRAGQAHRARPLQARGRQRHHRQAPATRSRTWATTSASTTCTSSSRRTPSARARAARPARHNKTLLTAGSLYVARFSGDSPAGEITGTGRAARPTAQFDGTGQWIPLVIDGVSQVPGFTRRRGAGQHAARRGRGRRDQDGPLRGRRAAPHAPAASTSRAPTTPTAAPGRQGGRDRGQPAQPQPRRPRHRDHRGGQRRGGDHVRLEHPPGLRRPGDEPVDLLRRASPPTRSRRSPARTTSRSTPTGNLWISTDGAPGAIGLLRRPVQGAARGPRARPRAAVPVGARGTARPAGR